jgi:phosphotransferase system IIA component
MRRLLYAVLLTMVSLAVPDKVNASCQYVGDGICVFSSSRCLGCPASGQIFLCTGGVIIIRITECCTCT